MAQRNMNLRAQFLLAAVAYGENLGDPVSVSRIREIADSAGIREPKWLYRENLDPTNPDMVVLPSEIPPHDSTKISFTLPGGSVRDETETIARKETKQMSTEKPVENRAPENRAPERVEADTETFVPPVMPEFVPHGNFKFIKGVVESGVFAPMYLAGPAGTGKTLFVKQACAQAGREMIRVNITSETDTDDLLGGIRLKNGETVFEEGPVVKAMKRGAVLLIDEISLGRNALLCLQAVLEGNPVYVQKMRETVHPQPGFTVFATDNTKGSGDETGKFIGTGFLNDAMLDRFAATFEFNYAAEKVEIDILTKYADSIGISTDDTADYIELLVKWAGQLRKTHEADAIDHCPSTRRLKHVLTNFSLLNRVGGEKKGNRKQAVFMACTRYDSVTQQAFMTALDAMDPSTAKKSKKPEDNWNWKEPSW